MRVLAQAVDPLDQAIEDFSAPHALLTGLVLVALGIVLSRFVARRFDRVIPRPAPPPPPELPPAAARFSPLVRGLLRFGQRLSQGPPASIRPILVPFLITLILVCDLATALALGRITMTDGDATAPAAASDPAAPIDLRTFAVFASVHLVATLLFLAFWTRAHGGGLADVGLTMRGAGPAMALAVLLYVAYAPVQFGALAIEHSLWTLAGHETPKQEAVRAFLGSPELHRDVTVLASLILVVPIYEELLFRGVVQQLASRVLRPAAAIGVGALLFTLPHDAGRLAVFALGAALSWLFVRTGSLLAPLLFHVVHNGAMLALVVAGSGP
jgi:membrane protease YdiL (CAAX protease family)